MLQVIHGAQPKSKPDINAIYYRAMNRAFDAPGISEIGQGDVWRKFLFLGVKYIGTLPKDKDVSEDDVYFRFYLAEHLFTIVGSMTPAELLTLFPVSKEYDGDRWEMKDYFFTMRELEGHGINERIGEQANSLLWDYMNPDIGDFMINYLSTVSDMRKLQGEPGLAEEWADSRGIRSFTSNINPITKRRFAMDGNGRSRPVRRKPPRYLKLIN